MHSIPRQLLDGLSTADRQAVASWWADLTEAARAAFAAGRIPADFRCPLGACACPMRQLLEVAPGRALCLLPPAAPQRPQGGSGGVGCGGERGLSVRRGRRGVMA